VRPEIRETDALEMWCRPGAVAGWVCWLVALASVVTMAVAIVGPSLLWAYAGIEVGYSYAVDRYVLYDAVPRFWFCGGLAIGFGVWLIASYALRSRLSRFVQVAVLLPVGYAIATLAIWLVWPTLSERMPSLARMSPLLHALPMSHVALGAAAATALAGWLVSRRRDALHGTTMIALANLLLVGLWLPIASALWWRSGEPLDVPSVAPVVLVPPFVLAVGYAALASRRLQAARKLRTAIGGLLGLALASGIVLRLEPNRGAASIYANFVHVLIALAAVAIASVIALAASIRIGALRARRTFGAARTPVSGVIASDAPVVARTEVTSWLRVPRTVVGAFAVTTPAGDVVVPAGAELVAPLPELTTQLAVGESIPVLRAGDRVVLAGFDAPDASHPFRGTAAWVPGNGRLLVAPERAARRGLVDAALAVWRPCVTLLAIVMLVSVVGLAGAISGPGNEMPPYRTYAARDSWLLTVSRNDDCRLPYAICEATAEQILWSSPGSL
jgi:hypothetical protein